MSDTIWVDVEGRPAKELPNDNGIMLELKDELDALCRELEVMPLSHFYDYSELAANYAEEMDDVPDNLPSPSWFDPDSGLKSVAAVAKFLAEHPERLSFSDDKRRKHWRSILLKELKDCEATLSKAETANQKFRLLVVP